MSYYTNKGRKDRVGDMVVECEGCKRGYLLKSIKRHVLSEARKEALANALGSLEKPRHIELYKNHTELVDGERQWFDIY